MLCSDEIKLRLEEFKNSCVFLFKDRKSDIGSAEVVIGEPRTERIREAKNLKFVQMTWAGADIYTRGGFPQGIKIANASGAFGPVIAEYVIGAILCVYRRFPEYIENQKVCIWRNAGAERTIEGKTALILGTGDIGSNIAKRLSAFGTKNIGIRRTGEPAQYFDEMHTLSNIDALLPRADLVIGCLPNTKETGHILNYDRLCLMKSDALFINVGRGSLIDTDALIRAAFLKEIPGTTKIIIAQRVASVEEADKIIVMDGGKIAACGTHDELMQTSEIYREVYESQTRGKTAEDAVDGAEQSEGGNA